MARVLVIDDEPDILLLCRVNLEHAGHEAIEAASGEHGLALLREQRPDAVVLDLMLPTIDGFDVLKVLELERASVDVPIVVLTAKSGEQDRRTSFEIGADEFIAKPFSPESLLDVLDELIAMSPRDRAAKREAKFSGPADEGAGD
ncbi:MAG: response regulator [Actinomycetota bacterium]|nr:response regulator [Actinomycetota bacterium]